MLYGVLQAVQLFGSESCTWAPLSGLDLLRVMFWPFEGYASSNGLDYL
ncbi:hypothetical protein HanXRQr2_Chr09g0371621 [Helianthus annuus]|uniref:Uncharacterized protein n=1 Tax=Helianthus annuus TaxID=4232 RepID=A0A9K3N7R7_HELAN|nr:hypothetical protein HanXRQr2_Chr09g0371621 [Helianthus annuus]KAJ0891777.1 hypothetical protein HanPSC8_Chr09g0358041 [Helianthus annuus]